MDVTKAKRTRWPRNVFLPLPSFGRLARRAFPPFFLVLCQSNIAVVLIPYMSTAPAPAEKCPVNTEAGMVTRFLQPGATESVPN